MTDFSHMVANDPWKYFELPPEEEQRLRVLFTAKVGLLNLPKIVDGILHDQSCENPWKNPHKVMYGIGDAVQIAGANLFIVGDFIGQYHKLGRRYKLPLLPREIMGFFRYPYNLFQDLNLTAQRRVVKSLNKKHKRGLVINGI